jgi:hypothetical protein
MQETLGHSNDRAAILFETTSKLIQSPSDIIGRRRASLLQKIIEDCSENQNKEPAPEKSHNRFLSRFLSLSCPCPVKTSLNKVKSSKCWIIFLLSFTVLFYVYDYYTDVDVICLFMCRFISLIYPDNVFCGVFSVSLSCHVLSLAYPDNSYCDTFTNQTNTTYTPQENWRYLSLNNTNSYEESYFVLERTIAYNFLVTSMIMVFVLVGSLLSAIQSLRSLHYRYKVNYAMKHEAKGETPFTPEEVLQRYRLTFAESSIEGTLQLCLQMSVYLCNAWVLTWMEEKVSHSQIADNPIQFASLWPSLVMSLLSQSCAQFKRRQGKG